MSRQIAYHNLNGSTKIERELRLMDVQYLTVDHLTLKEITRIFSRILIDPEVTFNGVPCWIWTGNVVAKYSMVTWRRQQVGVHRLIYAWLIEPVQKGSVQGNGKRPEIDHLCKNKLCCNPLHLEVVTRKINVERRNNACAMNGRKTHCKRGHEFTVENSYPVNGGKGCKTCKVVQDRLNYVARRKEGTYIKKSKLSYIAK